MVGKHVSSALPGAAPTRPFHLQRDRNTLARPTGNRPGGRDHSPSWHSRPVTEMEGNAAIENAAIQYVIAYETEQGRAATDTRGMGAPGDV